MVIHYTAMASAPEALARLCDPVHEVSAPPEAVADADEVFLTNSLIRIRPAFLGDPRDQPFTRWVFQRLRTRHS